MSRKMWLLAFILFVFWLAMTADLDFRNLLMGIGISLAVALLTTYLIFNHIKKISMSGWQLVRFLKYVPFLFKEIIKANIDVAARVLSPKMPVSPVIINFKFPLKEPLPQIILANSITLTPGTLTVDVKDGIFYIHCLSEEQAAGIFSGLLQEHVMTVYGERKNE